MILLTHELLDDQVMTSVLESLLTKIEERKLQKNPDPIKFYINCCGGAVYWGLTFHDIIKSSPTPIYTYNIGACYSAAIYVFLAGKKRYHLPNSDFLIHNMNFNISGDRIVARNESQYLSDKSKICQSIIADNTTITPMQLSEWEEKRLERYIMGEEIFQFGISKLYTGEEDE